MNFYIKEQIYKGKLKHIFLDLHPSLVRYTKEICEEHRDVGNHGKLFAIMKKKYDERFWTRYEKAITLIVEFSKFVSSELGDFNYTIEVEYLQYDIWKEFLTRLCLDGHYICTFDGTKATKQCNYVLDMMIDSIFSVIYGSKSLSNLSRPNSSSSPISSSFKKFEPADSLNNFDSGFYDSNQNFGPTNNTPIFDNDLFHNLTTKTDSKYKDLFNDSRSSDRRRLDVIPEERESHSNRHQNGMQITLHRRHGRSRKEGRKGRRRSKRKESSSSDDDDDKSGRHSKKDKDSDDSD